MTIVIKKHNVNLIGVTKGAVDEKEVQKKINKLPKSGGSLYV
jgi:hypothetical protein